MKKTALLLVIAFATVLVLSGCAPQVVENPGAVEVAYEDGTYRGTFGDSGYMQVSIQFALEDNIVTAINFRHLFYGNEDYRRAEEEPFLSMKDQYEQLIDYLIGKDIRASLADLYEPGDIVADIDGFTGATVRGSKVISAIRDGLNRGLY